MNEFDTDAPSLLGQWCVSVHPLVHPGHELAFVAFLCCLHSRKILVDKDLIAMCFLVFNKYVFSDHYIFVGRSTQISRFHL